MNGSGVSYGILTRKRVIVWSLVLLLVVAGLGILVGWQARRAAAAREVIDWELAAIVGTALGTTVLAGFTAALAFTTSGDVRATWRLAELQPEEMRDRDRPDLVLHSASFTRSADTGAVHIELWNVGRGPAYGIEMKAKYEGPVTDGKPSLTCSGGKWSAIGPGGLAQFAIQVDIADPPVGDLGGFTISGTYHDRAGKEFEVNTDYRVD